MPKRKPAVPFTGHWRFESMTESDNDFINAEVPGFIEFEPSGVGKFHFGYVRANLNGKVGLRDGKETIEFTFEAKDEMDDCSGRGWAMIEAGHLEGKIVFHSGDETWFVAKKAKGPRPRRK
jgi:hypothetical protein